MGAAVGDARHTLRLHARPLYSLPVPRVRERIAARPWHGPRAGAPAAPAARGWRSRRTTWPPRWRCERELGVSHAFAQVLVRRGLADPHAARDFLEPSEAHDPERVRRDRRGGRRDPAPDRLRAGGSSSTATTTSTASARRRSWSGRCARSARTSAGSCRAGSTTATGCRPRRCARLAGTATASCCSPSTARSRPSTRSPRARAAGLEVVVTDHHAPRADGRLPDCPIVHPGGLRLPVRGAVRHGRRLQARAGARGADTAEEDVELVALATVADVMPLRGENRRLVREGLAALAQHGQAGPARADGGRARRPEPLDTYALGFRLAPRINAAGTAAARRRRTRAAADRRSSSARAQIAAELDAVNVERRAVERQILWEAAGRGRAARAPAARTCWPPRAGIRE